ncbi:hypothetical protein IWQ61_003674 [Dispira simplex]|nr:hypothetical protein IWQ61_003674 [Dispira simplex]
MFEYQALTQYQRGNKKKTPLFMIHAASGLSLPYFGMPTLGRPMYGITNPYFNEPTDDPHRKEFQSIKEMAAAYIDLIKQVQPTGPYLLGGWSFGGIVALEIAQQLIRRDQVVLQIVMVDSPRPVKYDFPEEYDYFLVDHIISRAPKSDPNTTNKIRESYRNVQYLMSKYTTQSYHGKVTLIRCTKCDDLPVVMSPWEQELNDKYFKDPTNLWSPYLTNLEVVEIAVPHDDVFNPEHVETTTELINKAIESHP